LLNPQDEATAAAWTDQRLGDASRVAEFIDRAGDPLSTRVSGHLVTASVALMRTALAAGLELWMCPLFHVSDLVASGAVVPLLPDYGTPEMEIVALYPHRRQLGLSSTLGFVAVRLSD
jgi:DNA-binding transcriptional LysR family regulator